MIWVIMVLSFTAQVWVTKPQTCVITKPKGTLIERCYPGSELPKARSSKAAIRLLESP